MRKTHRLAALGTLFVSLTFVVTARAVSLAPTVDFQTQGNSSTASSGNSGGLTLNFRFINTPRSEYRFGMEFPTASIPTGSVISSVAWRGTASSVNNANSLLEFHGYSGNGSFAQADTYNPPNLLGQTTGIAAGVERSVALDPGYFSTLLGTATHFGLYARERTDGVTGSIHSRASVTPPRLDLAYIDPAAATSNRLLMTGLPSWSADANWSLGTPTVTDDVFIRPASTSFITAPSSYTEVNSLTVGGSGSAPVQLNVAEGPNLVSRSMTTIGAGGILKLDGTLSTVSLNTAPGGTINWATDGVISVQGGSMSTPIGDFAIDGADTPVLAMIGATMRKVNTNETTSDRLLVGDALRGLLFVAEQSDVRARIVRVGHQSSGIGSIQVEDAGTLFAPSSLIEIGPVGQGDLTISQQARMEAGLVFVGATLQGAIDNNDVDRLTISDPGTTAKASSIESDGRSIVEIKNGAVVDAGSIGGAGDPAQPPVFRVTGVGTRLNLTDRIQFGSTLTTNGSSKLFVESGARVDTGRLILGIGSGITGMSRSAMTVSGAGTQVNTSNVVLLGGLRDSDSSLDVLDGAILRAGNTTGIGYTTAPVPANTTGAVRISGAGSRWEQTGEIGVGGLRDLNGNLADLGTASLTIENGGVLTATTAVHVLLRGTLNLSGGKLESPLVTNNRGGAFSFTGGTLATGQFLGNLVQQGGMLAAGASSGTTTITGNYMLEEPGILELEVAAAATPGTGYDQYLISGDATLAGKLKVVLLNGFLPTLGDSFQFLSAQGTLNSMFDELQLPNLTGGLGWRLTAGAHALSLDVVTSLDGDFNHDNVVDAADYTVWRDGLNSVYTIDDYALWKSNFGRHGSGGSQSSLPNSIPEPSAFALAALALAGIQPSWRPLRRLPKRKRH